MRRLLTLILSFLGMMSVTVASADPPYSTNGCQPSGGWRNLTALSAESITGNAWRQYTVFVPVGESVWIQQTQDWTVERLSAMTVLMRRANSLASSSWIRGYGLFEFHRDMPNPATGETTRVRIEVGKPDRGCMGEGMFSAEKDYAGKITFTAYGVSTNAEANRSIGMYGSPGVTLISKDGGTEAFAFTEADFQGGKNEMLEINAPFCCRRSSIENTSVEWNATRGLDVDFRSFSTSTRLSAQTPDGPIYAAGGSCYPYISFVPVLESCYGPDIWFTSRTPGPYRFTIDHAENDPEIWLFGADVDPWAE